MRPEDIYAIQEGARLANFLPYLRDFVEKQVTQVENRVMAALETGKLTPEAALYCWMEVRSYRKLLRGMDQRVQVGSEIGKMNAKEFELNMTGGKDG